MSGPLLAARGAGRTFGGGTALAEVDLDVHPGQTLCLLGDNGAGKSTLIKLLSGVLSPTSGGIEVDGEPVRFRSPRDAQARGIATVHQDLGLAPRLGVARNFVLGREPVRWRGPLRLLDLRRAERWTREGVARMGVELDDVSRPVAELSGGQRQCVAIARAVHFGARVLILDEPTSALGVHQAGIVLRTIREARDRGLGVVLVTHNVQHAEAVGDHFAILRRGRLVARFERGGVDRDTLVEQMSGGRVPLVERAEVRT